MEHLLWYKKGKYISSNYIYTPKNVVGDMVDDLVPTMLFEVGDFIKVGGKTYKIISYKPNRIKSVPYLTYRCKEYVLCDGIMKSVMVSPKKPYISIIEEKSIKGKFIYNTKYSFWEYTPRTKNKR